MMLPSLADLSIAPGDRVLLRADFNVPIDSGRIDDDLRIRTALPTIEELRAREAALVICAHLDRPDGQVDERYSLAPIAGRLGELLDVAVPLAPHPVDDDVARMANDLEPGAVLLLENLRFDPGERADDEGFVRRLTALADHYVNDAFGTAHRAHASVVGPPRHLPSAAGLLMEREVEVLCRMRDEPDHPFVALIGGAKVADKLGVIAALLERCDRVCVGGALPYTFIEAKGHEIGDSMADPDLTDTCRDLLHSDALLLPTDVRVGDRLDAEATPQVVPTNAIPPHAIGLDIGPDTVEAYRAQVADARTLFWAGPMGAFEIEGYAVGTRRLAEAVAESDAFTVVGGGETASALRGFGFADRIDHISTGGGASLMLLELGDLPGLEALRRSARPDPLERSS